jgi:hypothetical protein
MPKGKKQTAGDSPLPQQRDERGGASEGSVERLGDRVEPNENTKLPHERDETTGEESTASATGEGNAELMKKAKADIDSGRQDTDRGPVTDATYHQLRRKK